MRAPANQEADHKSSDHPSSNQEARGEKRNPSHLKREKETRGWQTGVFVAIATRSVVIVERSAVLVEIAARSVVVVERSAVPVAIAERSVVVVERSAVLVLTTPRSWVRVPPWWFGVGVTARCGTGTPAQLSRIDP